MDDRTDEIRSLYDRCAQRVPAADVAKVLEGVVGYLRVRARDRDELSWPASNIATTVVRWQQRAADKKTADAEALDSPTLRPCAEKAVEAYRKMLIYRPDWAEEFWTILRSGLTDKLDAIDALAGLGGGTED